MSSTGDDFSRRTQGGADNARPGTADSPLDGPTDPKFGKILLVERYRIVRQLGQGGMGSVWLAEDTKLDNMPVAIKMLPSVLVGNKKAYAQVRQEALMSLKLVHTNIVPVRAFEEDNGNPFLVMDFIEGQSFEDYLAEKGPLTEAETVRLLRPVAEALDYAHGKGVVHRDVKPANVMIGKDGTPYVLDFGIAREVKETMTKVTGKLSSGTLMYMSPEQLHGKRPTPAQDVYSFAAMAYECLTGDPPFCRGQIEYQIEHDPPAPLGPQFANCGLGVMAGLAKTPESRPATCAAVLQASASRPQAERPRPRPTPPPEKPVAENEVQDDDSKDGGKGNGVRMFWTVVGLAAVGVVCWFTGRSNGPTSSRQDSNRPALSIESHQLVGSDESSQKGPKPGEEMTVTLPGGVPMTFCWCPAGSFQMGSPTSEVPRDDDEIQHKVTLTEGFWMGKYEVTQAEWRSLVRTLGPLENEEGKSLSENPSCFSATGDGKDRVAGLDTDGFPVEQVSWLDCDCLVKELNRRVRSQGLVFSLPTEAQWEYACRAGTTTPFSFGSSLNGDKANCDGNYPFGTREKGKDYARTVPAGSYASNAWGLHDMHGNVWEWCQDSYDSEYYAKSPREDPVNTASGADRVLRGGGWYDHAQGCRSANRHGSRPGFRYDLLGFRLVCSAGPRR